MSVTQGGYANAKVPEKGRRDNKMGVLVLVGLNKGENEIRPWKKVTPESKASWLDVLRDMYHSSSAEHTKKLISIFRQR